MSGARRVCAIARCEQTVSCMTVKTIDIGTTATEPPAGGAGAEDAGAEDATAPSATCLGCSRVA